MQAVCVRRRFFKEFPGEGYQVVFLDVCMEGTNGIETARQLRDADPELLIVFVTSSPEYVWDAFPVHPFGLPAQTV